jgi:hypothetical protein
MWRIAVAAQPRKCVRFFVDQGGGLQRLRGARPEMLAPCDGPQLVIERGDQHIDRTH